MYSIQEPKPLRQDLLNKKYYNRECVGPKKPIWEHKGSVSCTFTEHFQRLSLLFRELSGPTVDHWVNLVDPNWWWLNNLAILRVTFQQKGGYVNPFWISKLEHFAKWIRWKLEITNYIPSVTFFVKIIVRKTNKGPCCCFSGILLTWWLICLKQIFILLVSE